MQLEKLAATIRSRPGWEAVDLGFAMVRVWWWPLLRAWFVSAAPAALLLTALLWEHPGWAIFLVIWFKPLWSRVVLLVLSRSLFGTVPTARQVLLSLWELWRSDLWRALTYARLDPTRSYKLPVRQLEGLSGSRATQRTGLLSRRGGGLASALAMVCSLFETALIMAAVVLVLKLSGATLINVFNPIESLDVWSKPWVRRLCLLSYLPVLSLGETLFTAGGFALYLNRRVMLEGWDIELTFRRLSARLLATAALWLTLLLSATVLSTVTPAAHADDTKATNTSDANTSTTSTAATSNAVDAGDDASAGNASRNAMTRSSGNELTPQQTRDAARAILRGPELSRREKIVRYLPARSSQQASDPMDVETGGQFANLIGMLARPVMWGLGLVAVIAIVLSIIRSRSGEAFATIDLSTAPPEILVGLDVRPASLPDDVPAAARALWLQGQRIAALSLLYRASLVSLLHQRGVALAPSYTEGDCLRAAGAVLPSEAQRYLRRLTDAWQHAAYAQRTPSDDVGPPLIDEFSAHFSAAS